MSGGKRTERTQLFSRTLAGFGLTRRQKVNFSTFDGKLESQCTRNGPQTLHFVQGLSPGHFYYLFLDISPTYFPTIEHLEIWKSENPKIEKLRFTSKFPE